MDTYVVLTPGKGITFGFGVLVGAGLTFITLSLLALSDNRKDN